ncbi:MAG: sugar nucleotide-binding protein, partial [Chloroflexi bacterium]|nr:sugar nucleotide-binding protein [Chloroflexota bacterium]
MKIAVIGANGQLGTDLCKTLASFEVVPLLHKDIEITHADSVKEVLDKHKPHIIINTAAYVRVDDCETEPDKAFAVNA